MSRCTVLITAAPRAGGTRLVFSPELTAGVGRRGELVTAENVVVVAPPKGGPVTVDLAWSSIVGTWRMLGPGLDLVLRVPDRTRAPLVDCMGGTDGPKE